MILFCSDNQANALCLVTQWYWHYSRDNDTVAGCVMVWAAAGNMTANPSDSNVWSGGKRDNENYWPLMTATTTWWQCDEQCDNDESIMYVWYYYHSIEHCVYSIDDWAWVLLLLLMMLAYYYCVHVAVWNNPADACYNICSSWHDEWWWWWPCGGNVNKMANLLMTVMSIMSNIYMSHVLIMKIL